MGKKTLLETLPPEVAETLRHRAEVHGRTPEDEAIAILTHNLRTGGTLTVDEAWGRIRATGLMTPAEATEWIRADRDAR